MAAAAAALSQLTCRDYDHPYSRACAGMTVIVESLVNQASLRRRAVGDFWARWHDRLRFRLRISYCSLCAVWSVKGAGTGMSRYHASRDIVVELFFSFAKITVFGRSGGAPNCPNWRGRECGEECLP